jgi:transcriptional regulator with XRE-family HTH domain
MSSFGDRLKYQREYKNLTQEQLAARCDTSDHMIRAYEKNRNKPGYEMIIRLCDALLVNPDYLMQDDLSFNPYEDRNETFNDIAKLPPSSYQLLKSFVENLKNQGMK